MAGVWAREEVELIVEDHLTMLAAELRGESVNKTAHRTALMQRLPGRSRGSIEYKHQNVSAALVDSGYRHLTGYLPAFNYQAILADVVVEQLQAASELAALMSMEVGRPVSDSERARSSDGQALRTIEMPTRGLRTTQVRQRPASAVQPLHVNYLEREAQNASLGAAGEELVVKHEAMALHRIGARRLADKVEQVSRSRRDGLGYDVLSFEPDGTPRHIEVKTTRYSHFTPFFVTANEIDTSRTLESTWWLYRVFDFSGAPGVYTKRGRLDAGFLLTPTTWRASIP